MRKAPTAAKLWGTVCWFRRFPDSDWPPHCFSVRQSLERRRMMGEELVSLAWIDALTALA
jgi:hypothetical protein